MATATYDILNSWKENNEALCPQVNWCSTSTAAKCLRYRKCTLGNKGRYLSISISKQIDVNFTLGKYQNCPFDSGLW